MAASSATPSGPHHPNRRFQRNTPTRIAPFGSPRADRNRVQFFLLADWREAPANPPAASARPILSPARDRRA